jgi:hypothetical protein
MYRQENGHCRVPVTYRDPTTGYQLGVWVQHQRKAQATMPSERRARLDALEFEWDVLEAQWEKGVRFLEMYRQANGHCRVPGDYRDPASGYRLGSWVGNQRQGQSTISPERRARLDALGFVWEVLTTKWEEGFRALELYRQTNGHCRVPLRYRDSTTGYRLGRWVQKQREAEETLSPERRVRLDALGFVWKMR